MFLTSRANVWLGILQLLQKQPVKPVQPVILLSLYHMVILLCLSQMHVRNLVKQLQDLSSEMKSKNNIKIFLVLISEYAAVKDMKKIGNLTHSP